MNSGRFHISCILLLLLSACSHVSTARDLKDFRVRHFGDDVLPQSSVADICGDRDGFLWLITQMGLVRYDGLHFKVFTPENTPEMKTVRGIRLFRSKDNRIFFVDANGEMFQVLRNSLKRHQEMQPGVLFKFTGYKYPVPFWDNGIPGSVFDSREVEDLPGGRKLLRLKYYTPYDTLSTVQGDTSVSVILFVDNHLVVIDSRFNIRTFYPGKPAGTGIKIEGDIVRDPLFKDPAAFKAINCSSRKAQPYLLFGNTIYSLSITGNVIHTTAVIEHITIPDIESFYADERNGYYAVGTSSNGLYILTPKNFFVRLLNATTYDNAFSAVEHIGGSRFLSAKGGYVFDLFSNEQAKADREIGNFSLFREDRRIWVSTQEWLGLIDVKRPTHVVPYKQLTPGSDLLQCVQKDHLGRTWIASLYALHLLRKDSVRRIPLKNVGIAASNGVVIETIHFVDKNTLWIACRQTFIAYNINTGEETVVPEMKDKYVRNMIADKDGGTWLLTYGNGYFYYRNGKFIRFPLDARRYLAAAHTMLKDRNGFRWMSTNRGLFRVNDALLHRYISDTTTIIRYEYFDKESGFLTNEFNGGFSPAGYVYSDSLFLLSSMKGLVYFNPLKLKTPPLDNGIFIDEVLIDGKRQPVRDNYKVPADFTSFYCECSSPFFGSKENIQLEYKVDGLMKGWQPLIDDHYIQVNRLQHGSYKIHIRKLIDFSSGKTEEITCMLVVAQPWYLSTWFLVLLSLFLTAFIWLFVQLRLRLLTRQKRKLEDIVQERTNQLRTTVQTLEQSRSELSQTNRFKEQLTSIVLHDIQTPLRFLRRVVKNILHTHPSLSPGELKEELDDLYYSTEEVASYSENFLIWIKSQKDSFEVVYDQVSLSALIEEIGNLYQRIAQNAGATISISSPEDVVLLTDRALLSIIVRNLTDNAIKYAPNGHIKISALRDGVQVIIRVTDDGKGMSEEQVDKIMTDDSSNRMIAVGKLGYQFIKDMLRVLGGTLKIESRPGVGTKVSLLFPIR